jgi:predicted DNA-binding antitoxin AbrB/MazE fold protein
MVIHAVYENGVFRPTEPVELPEKCQVRILIDDTDRVGSRNSPAAALARLAAIAAEHPSNPKLPNDLAEQHDHYLRSHVRSAAH